MSSSARSPVLATKSEPGHAKVVEMERVRLRRHDRLFVHTLSVIISRVRRKRVCKSTAFAPHLLAWKDEYQIRGRLI